MSLFKQAVNEQAYLKAGIMGFMGAGKTHTGTLLAIGIYQHALARGQIKKGTPALFLDTETGSDWVIPMFEQAKIPLHTLKSRAFKDLCPAVQEAAALKTVLLIDSITHPWRELCESYSQKKGRRRGLTLQDWGILKGSQYWGRFSELFVNSTAHLIMCGRAGYEFDFFENENGKRELEKTGIKMKTETETGYEPNLLILMERAHDLDANAVHRVAHILKDRSRTLDGKQFKNPTFKSFLPHVNYLNIGGPHVGVDSARNSAEIVEEDERRSYEKERKEVALDEIQSLLLKHFPGQTKEDKKSKIEWLERAFETTSWEKVKTLPVGELTLGHDFIKGQLEGTPKECDGEGESITMTQGKSFVGKEPMTLHPRLLKNYLKKYGPTGQNTIPAAEMNAVKMAIEVLDAAGDRAQVGVSEND